MSEILRRNEAALRPMREMQSAVLRPPSIDHEAHMEWVVRRNTAPVRTQEAAEAMLAELQVGAERERRMLRLAAISVGVAVVGGAATVAGILLVLLG